MLHIDDCPNWLVAGSRVVHALEKIGAPHVEVAFRLLSTPAEAAAVPFAGSPTILVDGHDLFPTDVEVTGLACRVYTTDAGLSGAPSDEQIVAALRARVEQAVMFHV